MKKNGFLFPYTCTALVVDDVVVDIVDVFVLFCFLFVCCFVLFLLFFRRAVYLQEALDES